MVWVGKYSYYQMQILVLIVKRSHSQKNQLDSNSHFETSLRHFSELLAAALRYPLIC
jgi:hypothetical protein